MNYDDWNGVGHIRRYVELELVLAAQVCAELVVT